MAAKEKTTACTLDCPDACSLIVSALPNGEYRIQGNPRHPVTAGFTCRKIKSFARRLAHPDRIRYPLLRRNGAWERIGWEEALDRCAAVIDRCRHQPGSILHIQGDGAKGVVKESVKLFFAALGATGTRGALCDGAGYEACLRDFGSRENHDLEDLRHAGKIVNWGKDLARTSIHLAATVQRARRRGARLLTISPGADGSHRWSDLHLGIAPGGDRFLAAAAILKLIEAGGAVPEALQRCANWPAFRTMMARHSPAELIRQSGAGEEALDTVLEWYDPQSAAATIVGTGLQRYRHGGETVRYINALAMISGHIGRRGGGVCYHLNSMKNFNLSWMAGAADRPRRSVALPFIGRDIVEARDPEIAMVWINGCNIVNQAPDARQVARALRQVPFTVVVDAFMTDTAGQADLVLPATLMLEQEDLIGSFLHDYVHHAPAVVDPPGEARDDLSIVRDLARRLAMPIALPAAEWCMEKALDSPHLGIALDRLRACGFMRALHPRVPYADGRFDHPDGRYRLPESLAPPVAPDKDFPMSLMTWVRGDAIHSQITPEEQSMPPRIWIAPECPAWRGIDPAKPVLLESRRGRMAVRLERRAGLHPAAVLYRRGDWATLGGGANRLIEAAQTDMGETAAYYDQGVRIVNG